MENIDNFNAQIIAEFREHGGKIGGLFEGGNFLILHTRGVRSGLKRLTPVAYLPYEGRRYVVAAGLGDVGARHHPAWFHNLIAHPDLVIEVGSDTEKVRATVIDGEERRDVWAAFVRAVPHFARYDANPNREVPIVVLDPVQVVHNRNRSIP